MEGYFRISVQFITNPTAEELCWVLEHGDFKGRPLHTPFDLGNYTVVVTVNLITISDDAQTGAEYTPPKPFLVPFFGNRKHR